MDTYSISNLLGNLDKVSAVVEKIGKQKTMRIKSQLHRDFSWTFRLLITFFKLIGLATFTHCVIIQKKRSPRALCTYQYSRLGVLYNAVLISLMIGSNYLSIPYRISLEYVNKTNLTVTIEIVQTVLGTVVMCAIMISYCVGQESLVRIANRLTDVEYELDRLFRLCAPLRRQRVFRTFIFICLLNGCLLIALLISEYFAFHSSPISWLTDVLPTFHVGWFMIQYSLLVNIIHADFIDVNREIRNVSGITTPDLRPQTFYETRRIVVSNSAVRQLLLLQDVRRHLCDISEDLSDFCSLPILFGVTYMFLTLIYNGYYLLSPLLLSDEVLHYDVFINTVIWLLFVIYPIVLLTSNVTKILYEVCRHRSCSDR